MPSRKSDTNLLSSGREQGSIYIPKPIIQAEHNEEEQKAAKVLQFYIRVYLGRKRRKKKEEEMKRRKRFKKVSIAEQSRDRRRTKVARLKAETLREEWKAKLLKSEADKKMQQFKTFSEAFEIIKEKTGVKTVEEMQERFEKAEEKNLYEFERVRTLMIEGAELMEKIEAKKAEVAVLKARNTEAEAPRRRIIDKIQTQIQTIRSQMTEVQLEKTKIQEEARIFRHGFYDLFETIGYTINDPNYKSDTKNADAEHTDNNTNVDNTTKGDEKDSTKDAAAKGNTEDSPNSNGENKPSLQKKNHNEYNVSSKSHSSVSRHRLSTLIAAERDIYELTRAGKDEINFATISGEQLVRLLDNVMSSLQLQIQEAEHAIERKKKLEREATKRRIEKGKAQLSPNGRFKQSNVKKKSTGDEDSKNLEPTFSKNVKSGFKSLPTPSKNAKTIGPNIESGTIFEKLPDQTIDMAYLNVARKFPAQELKNQGMPINVNRQRQALMEKLKEEIENENKAKLTLAKLMRKSKVK
eukprot:g4822.t1